MEKEGEQATDAPAVNGGSGLPTTDGIDADDGMRSA
jgi:hypothetical protein